MVLATYFYYEKVCRTMRTTIVSNLLKALVFVKITSNKLREFGLSEQKASLNNKITVSAVSQFTLSTSINGQCIASIIIFKLPCYLPISGNSYKIIII